MATLFELADLVPILPHRAPFLFVDRVTGLEPGRRIVAERTLREDEAYFAGHFPGHPLMPGVLVAEALAQASGLLLGLTDKLAGGPPPTEPKSLFLARADLKFTHPAVPGDVLQLRSVLERSFAGLFRFEVEASVGHHLIANGTLTLAQIP